MRRKASNQTENNILYGNYGVHLENRLLDISGNVCRIMLRLCMKRIFYLCKLFDIIFKKNILYNKMDGRFNALLHKKGDINQVENYRGITLLRTLGKLFSRILNNRLTDWAEEYHIYVEAQPGLRKNMGTIDNIFVLHSVINHMLKKIRNYMLLLLIVLRLLVMLLGKIYGIHF